MRLKLDENLPDGLVALLRERGFDADSVPDEGLGGAPDAAVWEAAQSTQRFLITQDLDFADLRRFTPGTHCGLLLVRLREDEQWQAAEHVVEWMARAEARSWAGCVVVATPRKIRVLRPAEPE